MRWGLIVIILLIVLGGIYLLGYNRAGTSINTNTPTPQQTVTPFPTSASQSASPILSPSASITTSQHEVTLTSAGFTPAIVTIKPGDSVIWINQSGAPATVNSNPHPTHTDYPPLNLGTFNNGSTLSLTFPKAGIYGYHNHLDPSQKGTIIVK